MEFLPLRGDYCTTVSHTRGRVTKINTTEKGCTLTLRVKDMRTQELRDVYVSSLAVIEIIRDHERYAVKRTYGGSFLLPMATSLGEQEYHKYARNKPARSLQDLDPNRDKVAVDLPVYA